MKHSDAINELATALAKAQAEMDAAQKTGNNPFFRSSYATFEDVRNASIPSLTKYGLSILQPTEVIGERTFVYTMLLHSSGQWLSGMYPVISQKQDPQSLKSALTYARRSSWESMVGIATTDDDAEAAMSRDKKGKDVSSVTSLPSTNTPKTGASSPKNDAPASTNVSAITKAQAILDEKDWTRKIPTGQYKDKTFLEILNIDSSQKFKYARYWHEALLSGKTVPEFAQEYLDLCFLEGVNL